MTVALLIITVIITSGNVLLVIFAEVYLMDRLCCVVTEIKRTDSSIKTKSLWKDPEDEVDRKVARNHSKG